MKTKTAKGDAKTRILDTACDLFYRNGYRATGINEIIEKSGVAKATFYDHFPSKEDLALAYIRKKGEAETQLVLDSLEKYPGPYEKLLGIFEFLIPWAKERDYRGCAYMNIAGEVLDPNHPVREESTSHYRALRALVGRLMNELKAQRGAAWKDRDADKVADDFHLLFVGSLALSQVHHDAGPFREALAAAERLLA